MRSGRYTGGRVVNAQALENAMQCGISAYDARRTDCFRTVDERSASGVVGSVPRAVLQEAADRQHAHLPDLAVAR